MLETREQNAAMGEILHAKVAVRSNQDSDWGPLQLEYTSSTAQGGGGSFKNRKPIGEVGVVNQGRQSEATDGPKGAWCLLSFALFLWLSTYLPIYLLCIYLSIYRSIYLSLSFICLSV